VSVSALAMMRSMMLVQDSWIYPRPKLGRLFILSGQEGIPLDVFFRMRSEGRDENENFFGSLVRGVCDVA
jgi:hypothetical protein